MASTATKYRQRKPDAVGRPTKIKAPAKKPDRKPLTQQELAEIAAKKAKIDHARAIVEVEKNHTECTFVQKRVRGESAQRRRSFF